jgi:precorrin-6Y C5,15-methyltransferase (decarboxylating)
VKRVTVFGCDGREVDVGSATLVIGSQRHRSDVDIVLGPIEPAVEAIRAHEGEVAVLASGDPGFFGIVRRLAEFEPVVKPGVSSVAMAFARLGMAWDDAVVVSAHGRSLRRVLNVCRAHPKVAVLTGPGAGPREIRDGLAGWQRRIVVVQRLGAPGERVSGVDDGPWDDPNVVLVLGEHTEAGMGWIAGAQPGPARWALPESDYAHRDSMITKAEVRALVLARLGPRIGDLVWDVGSGSGSVAVECARFGAAVIAIERDDIEAIERNSAGLSVRIIRGSAPECLAGLPGPDAAFVGGGGLAALTACAAREPERLVATVAGVDRVAPFLQAMQNGGYRVEAVQLQANRLIPLPDGSHRLGAANPVFVLSGIRP